MKEKSFIMLLYFWLQTEKPNVKIWQFFLLLPFGNGNTNKSFQFLIFNYVSLGEILIVKQLVMFDGHAYFIKWCDVLINICSYGNSNIKLFFGLLLASS
jgi:hypothetical protein